jgi:glyoxylase-like metal-dependent hydrolase (beta-lactamase superfamily II)
MLQIVDGLAVIPGRDDMIPDSHVYLIGYPESHDLSLVDAGLMGKGKFKIDTLKAASIPLQDIKRIIMTHTHLDHIGCLSELRQAIGTCELWVHKIEAEELEKGDDRTVYGMDMFKQMCQTQYNIPEGAFTLTVDRKLQGGEVLNMGGMAWEVIHVPGHSAGGIALYNKELKALIPGDVVYADYAIGRFDLFRADGPELKNSLLRLSTYELQILLPGHNQVVKNVPPGYITSVVKQWGPYLV